MTQLYRLDFPRISVQGQHDWTLSSFIGQSRHFNLWNDEEIKIIRKEGWMSDSGILKEMLRIFNGDFLQVKFKVSIIHGSW